MIKSMTGFGSVDTTCGEFFISIEIKSVNNRYLDMKIRVPSDWNDMDLKIRELIQKKFHRGNIDVSVKREIIPDKEMGSYTTNIKLAKHYVQAAHKISRSLRLDKPTIDHILRNTDFIRYKSKKLFTTGKWKLLKGPIERVCNSVERMRLKEGKNLERDVLKYLKILTRLQVRIIKRIPHIHCDMMARLQERMKEYELPTEVNKDRLEQEIVLLTHRADISEEVVRLKSHLEQCSSLIFLDRGPVGKQFDFLIQELNREINTISSKSHDLEIHNTVVLFKTTLERMREQIQNIE